MRIFSSALYCLRVARRISRTCASAVPCGPDFWLIFAPCAATMIQKSSVRKNSQSVSWSRTVDRASLPGRASDRGSPGAIDNNSVPKFPSLGKSRGCLALAQLHLCFPQHADNLLCCVTIPCHSIVSSSEVRNSRIRSIRMVPFRGKRPPVAVVVGAEVVQVFSVLVLLAGPCHSRAEGEPLLQRQSSALL